MAVYVAHKDKMDLAVNIAVGSAAQIALFAIPLLVLLSFVIGDFPMPFVFNGFELAGIILAVVIAIHVTSEGETTWFEGLELLAVYVVLGVTFYCRLTRRATPARPPGRPPRARRPRPPRRRPRSS